MTDEKRIKEVLIELAAITEAISEHQEEGPTRTALIDAQRRLNEEHSILRKRNGNEPDPVVIKAKPLSLKNRRV